MTPEQFANYIEEVVYENVRLAKCTCTQLTSKQYTWAAIAAISRVMLQLLAEDDCNKEKLITKQDNIVDCVCGRPHTLSPKTKSFKCPDCKTKWTSEDGIHFTIK